MIKFTNAEPMTSNEVKLNIRLQERENRVRELAGQVLHLNAILAYVQNNFTLNQLDRKELDRFNIQYRECYFK